MDREGETLTRVGNILGTKSVMLTLTGFLIWLLVVVLAIEAGAGAAR